MSADQRNPADPLWSKDPWAASNSSSSSSTENERWPSFEEALAEERRSGNSSDEVFPPAAIGFLPPVDETTIDALIADRLKCIEPHLRSELLSALGRTAPAQTTDPCQKLRRDVAAHPRGSAASEVISQLDQRDLKRAQEAGRKDPDMLRIVHGLAVRVSSLEATLKCDYRFNTQFCEILGEVQGAAASGTSSCLNINAAEFVPGLADAQPLAASDETPVSHGHFFIGSDHGDTSHPSDHGDMEHALDLASQLDCSPGLQLIAATTDQVPPSKPRWIDIVENDDLGATMPSWIEPEKTLENATDEVADGHVEDDEVQTKQPGPKTMADNDFQGMPIAQSASESIEMLMHEAACKAKAVFDSSSGMLHRLAARCDSIIRSYPDKRSVDLVHELRTDIVNFATLSPLELDICKALIDALRNVKAPDSH